MYSPSVSSTSGSGITAVIEISPEYVDVAACTVAAPNPNAVNTNAVANTAVNKLCNFIFEKKLMNTLEAFNKSNNQTRA